MLAYWLFIEHPYIPGVFIIMVMLGVPILWLFNRRGPLRAKLMRQLADDFGLTYERIERKRLLFRYPYKMNIISGIVNGRHILIYDEISAGGKALSSAFLSSFLSGGRAVLGRETKTTNVLIDNSLVATVSGKVGNFLGNITKELRVSDIRQLLEHKLRG